MTILFTDLVGSTSRAEGLDPEDVRATLSSYYAQLRAELERHGGTVEKFIGDAVMAVFGAPVSHEDDAERAVRAALAIRDSIGEELQIRTAVNTGEALVALGREARRGRRDGGGRRGQYGRAAAGRGAGQRDPGGRGNVPRDAAGDRLPRGAAGRGERKGRAGQGVGGGRRPLALRQRRGAEVADAARRPRA